MKKEACLIIRSGQKSPDGGVTRFFAVLAGERFIATQADPKSLKGILDLSTLRVHRVAPEDELALCASVTREQIIDVLNRKDPKMAEWYARRTLENCDTIIFSPNQFHMD